jgi:hypothetical protein
VERPLLNGKISYYQYKLTGMIREVIEATIRKIVGDGFFTRF